MPSADQCSALAVYHGTERFAATLWLFLWRFFLHLCFCRHGSLLFFRSSSPFSCGHSATKEWGSRGSYVLRRPGLSGHACRVVDSSRWGSSDSYLSSFRTAVGVGRFSFSPVSVGLLSNLLLSAFLAAMLGTWGGVTFRPVFSCVLEFSRTSGVCSHACSLRVHSFIALFSCKA